MGLFYKIIVLSFVALLAWPLAALADCTVPDGKEGTIVFNNDVKLMQFCDGTDWISMGGDREGCPVGGHGTGYFVITNGTWNGDLETAGAGAGGMDGAHKLCLADLTANDWMGKVDAQARGLLNASHVKAFIASIPPMPNTEYFFAVSGDASKGGASFTTDETGAGPGNNANWSGASYFDGSKNYWASRGTTDAEHWRPTNSAGATCSTWSDGTGGNNGWPGDSNQTDAKRWYVTSTTCDTALHLVCMVHP